MTYDDRKVLRDQEFVEEIEIFFNGCKYAVDPFGDQNIFVKTGIDSYSAASVNFTLNSTNPTYTTWYAQWLPYPAGDLYAITGSEIVKCEVVDSTNIKVTARGQFGTTAATISGTKAFRFMHAGEADGSCRGYSQTCSDSGSYDPDVFRALKFCSAPRVAGSLILQGLFHKKIDYESAEADIGESIGSPAKLKFSLQDFTGADGSLVPYPDRRSSAGTFWGRTLARNPYANGRKVIYRSGLRGAGTFVDPDWIERHFIIDTVSLSDGNTSFSCLDPVILTEDKKAKMPVVSPAQLSAAITGTPATFSYVNAPNYYFGAMSASIWVRIDSEVIQCTVSGATQLTVVNRGYRSEAKNHEAGATIQDCVRFAGTHVIDAIVFSLENFTSMPASYIDDYAAVKALIPTIELDEAILSKSQSVAEFISSMIKLGNLIFYFDEALLKIVIDYIPELSIQPITINETEHILRGSVSVNENTKEQYTRFAHLWAPVDITKDAEENYAINYLAANLDVESPSKLGEVNEKKAFKNPLLTSSSGDSLIGSSYCSRIVTPADRSPKIITATINAGSIGPTQGGNLKIGSIVSLSTKESQNIDGIASSELYQALKISGNAYENFRVKMRRYLAVQPSGVDFVISAGGENYDLSDNFSPGAGNYTVYIDQGVVFGSYDVAIPAFTTGSQAAGVSFNIILRGSMLGAGGEGSSAPRTNVAVTQGQSGGIAFEATVPCTIDCGAGLIWAGGGGASADHYVPPQGPGPDYHYVARSGGGGGQGFGIALGGFGSNGSGSATARAESGTSASPGINGCPNGGEWGAAGQDSADSPYIIGGPTPGGLAGEAIKSNGNTVTISAGNNDFNIRGRRT